MKKIIIAAAIVLTSGLTALSVTKATGSKEDNTKTVTVRQSDFASRSFAGNKSDLATIE